MDDGRQRDDGEDQGDPQAGHEIVHVAERRSRRTRRLHGLAQEALMRDAGFPAPLGVAPADSNRFLTATTLLDNRAPGGKRMRSVMLTVIMCVGVGASAAAQDAKAKGEQLFVEQKCTLCHSIGDKGNKKGPLDGVASKISADEIRSWITDAKGMTAKAKATRKPE